MYKNNPYSYGPLVADPAMFFGREEELKTLITRLRNKQSTSIVGMRRIGKSSLLYQLTCKLSDLRDQRLVPVYIDLHDARYRTVASFVDTTLQALDTKTGGALSLQGATDMPGFSKAVDRMCQVGNCPLLCLDEFEEFIEHREEFNDVFIEGLRALAGQQKLAMVTTSRMPLTDLVKTGRWTSPFYNIFSQVELGLLESDAAQVLRRIPLERQKIALSPEDEALIQELAGRHPFFLQMACYHLYEALSQPQNTRAEIVCERFNHDAEPQFEQLWGDLHADEKAALKVVVDQAVPSAATETTLGRLARFGVVEKAGENWRIFSAAFARDVQQYPVQPIVVERPEPPEKPQLSLPTQLLLFAGVAVVVVIVATLVSLLLPQQQFRSMLITAALILLFALVGAGKLTGHDFLEFLGRLLGLGGF